MSLNPEYSPEPRRPESPPQRIPPEPYQPGPEAYHTETEKHGPEFDPQPGPEPTAPAHPPETTPAVTRKTSLGTRTGWTWVGLIASALILIVLLIFILQNLNSVRVGLLFWEF